MTQGQDQEKIRQLSLSDLRYWVGVERAVLSRYVGCEIGLRGRAERAKLAVDRAKAIESEIRRRTGQ